LYSLNNGIFVERNFENPYCANVSKLKQESKQILMNGNSKSFYSRNMFEFIHHPKYTTKTTYENLLKDNILVVDSTSLQRKMSTLEALRSIYTILWLCNLFISNTMQCRMFPTPTSSKGSTITIV
jgi:hypothetical protein